MSSSVCHDRAIDLPYAIHGNLFLAIVIIISLAFLQRRKKKWLDCCKGRPGALIPVNMLDNFENRWSFACSFGAITNVLISLLLGKQAFTTQINSVFLTFFLALIYAVEISIVFFPFFACLTIPQKKVGSLVGLCYTGLWSVVMLIATIDCADPYPEGVRYAGLLIQLPSLLCLGFLTGKFAIMTYHAYKRHQPPPVMKEETVAAPYQVSYVRTLLSKTSAATADDAPAKGFWMKFKHFVSVYFYENRPHFKYTTRIVCTFFLVVTGTVQLGTTSLLINAAAMNGIEELLPNVTSDIDYDQIKSIFVTFKAIWIITAIFSVLFVCVDICVILTKYRGDYSFFPHNFKNSSGVILKNSMIFPGYQIAYKIVGFFLLNFVLLIILYSFAGLIVVPLILGTTEILSWLVQAAIIPALLGLLIKYCQILVAKQVLLQEKIHPDDQDKPLAVHNRRLYHIVNYFLFIANIGLGLFSAFFRLLLSFAWGVIFLGRVDRCVLVPGFETRDKGYMSYLGMLLVEHTHNNPTMRVFCQNLLEVTRPKQNGVGFLNENYEMPFGHTASNMTSPAEMNQKLAKQKQIQKRWSVLITLLNNPELIPLRSHNLGRKRVSQKEAGKIVQIFKTGMLGIIPSSSAAVSSQTHNNETYHLRALVAKRQNERFQRSTSNATNDDTINGIHTTSENTDNTEKEAANGSIFTVTVDNELQNYTSPDENC